MTRTGNRGGAAGFTMIELIVVLVVVGVLAAIAIPVFLNQRGKAHDSSTIADVTRLGSEVAAAFVDGGTPALDFTDPQFVVVDDGRSSERVALSNGTARPTSGYAANLADQDGWCVSLTDSQGVVKQYRYSARDGLERGGC